MKAFLESSKKTTFIFAFIWVFLWTLDSEAKIQFKLGDGVLRSISADAKSKLTVFLTETLMKAPPVLMDRLSSPNSNSDIYVSFRTFVNTQPISAPDCKALQGRALPETKDSRIGSVLDPKEPDQIWLNIDFYPTILRGPESSTSYNCGYGNLYHWAQAEVLKQLTIISEKNLPYRFSQSPTWKSLLSRLEPKISKETTVHLAERFASYVSYYLIDGEFQCRMPAVNYFFNVIFNLQISTANKPCQLNSTVWLTSSGKKRMIALDRLYQVDLLVADAGANLESRWGHIMFRLAFCDPKRKLVNAECLKDLNHHLVVGYLGSPTRFISSLWEGLGGKYPTRLVVEDFAPILNEYTIKESRNLISIPIRLNSLEKKLFAWRAIEEYWIYQGHYYFLTNNCVTEALHFLQSIPIHHSRLQNLNPWIETPQGLKNALNTIGMLDSDSTKIFYSPQMTKVPSGIDQPLEDGLAIQSPLPSMIDSIDPNLSPAERRILFDEERPKDPGQIRELAQLFYKNELSIYQTGLSKIDASIQRILLQEPNELNDDYRKLQFIIRLNQRLLLPTQRALPNYGVPQRSEFRSEKLSAQAETDIIKAQQQVRDLLKRDKPGIFSYMKETNENMIYFYSFIKPAQKAQPKEKL